MPLDILVSTPQHIVAQMTEGCLSISDVQYLVLDEADTIFEGGFGQDVYAVVRPLRKRGKPLATIVVSATMNAQLKQAIQAEFPDMEKAETSSLHKAIKGSNHVFMPLQPGQDKLSALFQVCRQPLRCVFACWQRFNYSCKLVTWGDVGGMHLVVARDILRRAARL
jgi:superfamily II DNA/RNA helicase